MADDSDVCVRRFTDDGKVWASLDHEVLHLKAVEHMEIDESATNSVVLHEGDLCVVKGEKHTWKRGKIRNLLISICGTQAELFLIDRGITLTLPLRKCIPLPSELLQCPPLVKKYTLKGLQPCTPTSRKWSEQVMELLLNLTGTEKDMERFVKCTIYPGDVITLFVRINGITVSFNECLLHAKLAVASSHVVTSTDFNSKKTQDKMVFDSFEEPRLRLDEKPRIVKGHLVQGVYIEGRDLNPWTMLSTSQFSPVFQKGLLSLGFQYPMSSQAYSWPYIWEGDSVVLVSPSNTGKTLAYLLPLLAGCVSNTHGGPSLVIVVGTSWQTKSVHIQVKRILSWISAEKRFRCCYTYNGVEPEAVHCLINGVDVVVGTPPSILRLVASDILSLRNVYKLVLDDGNDLAKVFLKETCQIVSKCGVSNLDQVVITASKWSSALQSLMSKFIVHPIVITTCSMEASVRANVNMSVLCTAVAERMSSLLNYVADDCLIIFTSSPEEATALQKAFQLHSWPCLNVQNEEDCRQIDRALTDSKLVVISDSMVDCVLRQQLSLDHVVHYSLPSSKKCFQHRLSILFPAFKKRVQCQCAVILTEEDSNRAPMFTSILNRLSQIAPKALQNMSNERDARKSGFDLCYHLKAWGHCKLDSCPSIHSLVQNSASKFASPRPNPLPLSGIVEVSVKYVSNATRLWVSVLRHFPEAVGDCSVPSHDPGVLVLLSLKLAEFYSEPDNKVFQDCITEGVYCGLEDSDGSFYRVRVLKFSQPLGFYFPHKEQARVRLIDVGSVQIVDVNQLLVLPEHFLEVPTQVIEAFLCGVIPLDNDPDWSEEAVSFSQSILQGKILHGRVALSVQSSQTIWLDPVEERVTLTGIGVSTAVSNSAQELSKAQYAKASTKHLPLLRQILRIPGNKFKAIEAIEWCSLPLKIESDVYVSAMSSPSLFYVQLMSNLEKLDDLEDTLNTANTVAVPADFLTVGCLCVAQFPIDKKWYRGQVLENEAAQSNIFFVDHGDTEWVPDYLIQHIHSSLLELPAQAIECSFPESTWINSAGGVLWDCTRDEYFKAQVLGVTQSKTPGIIHHSITLKETSSGSCLSVRLSTRPDAILSGQDCFQVSDQLMKKSINGLLSLESSKMHFAELLESQLISNPMLAVDYYDDLEMVFKEIHKMEDSVCIHILRGYSSLLSSGHLRLETYDSYMDWITSFLKRDNPELLKITLQFLKFILSHSSYHAPKHCLQELCLLVIKWESDFSVITPVLEILSVTKDVTELEQLCHVLKILCTIVLTRPFSWSCLEVLNSIATSVTWLPVICDLLPIDRFCTTKTFKEAMDCPMLACVLLSFLWKLCKDDSYMEQVQKYECWMIHFRKLNHPIVIQLLESIFSLNVTKGDSMFKTLKGLKSSTPSRKKHETFQRSLICPKVLWSQSRSHVLLAVQLRDCKDHDVAVQTHFVQFRAHVNDSHYGFDLFLSAPVASKDYKITITSSEVLIHIPKESDKVWPHLTVGSQRLQMFSIDFDRWDNCLSDSEDTLERNIVSVKYRGSSSSESQLESDNEDKQLNEFLDFQI